MRGLAIQTPFSEILAQKGCVLLRLNDGKFSQNNIYHYFVLSLPRVLKSPRLSL